MRTGVRMGLLVGLLLLAGCAPALGSGTVSIWLAAGVQNRDQPASLEIQIETAGVHQAGQPIDAGWVAWPPERADVDLVRIESDGPVEVGIGAVPAGHYDRVRIVVETGEAYSADGAPVPLTVTVEPIALPFDLRPDDHVDVTIQLIALAKSEGGYELFTKSATVR